jgi:hypothetical protein
MGHSAVRVTQDLYVSPDGDLFERFLPGDGVGLDAVGHQIDSVGTG